MLVVRGKLPLRRLCEASTLNLSKQAPSEIILVIDYEGTVEMWQKCKAQTSLLNSLLYSPRYKCTAQNSAAIPFIFNPNTLR